MERCITEYIGGQYDMLDSTYYYFVLRCICRPGVKRNGLCAVILLPLERIDGWWMERWTLLSLAFALLCI